MNIYISVDMEGVTGVCDWNQVTPGHVEYPRYRSQMAREVRSACEAALAAGATRVLVKDAHASARNLDGSELPAQAELISGWSGHPLNMVQEINEDFEAALFIGYHTPAGLAGNSLAHTFSTKKVAKMRLNGKLASEYLICAHAAEMYGVPVVFVSGDEVLCEHVAEHAPACRTLATMRGVGASAVSRHPGTVVEGIYAEVQQALAGNLDACRLKRPTRYELEIDFKLPTDAYAYSFFPGAERIAEATVHLSSEDYLDILRAIKFLN